MIDERQNERQRGKRAFYLDIFWTKYIIMLNLPRILTNCNHQFPCQEHELRFNNDKYTDDVIIKKDFILSLFYFL